MAKLNGCSGGPAVHWPTLLDGQGEFYCSQPYGQCTQFPVVRCTWNGKHRLPFRGRKVNTNVSHRDKVYAFGRLVAQWMHMHYLRTVPPALAPVPSAPWRVRVRSDGAEDDE